MSTPETREEFGSWGRLILTDWWNCSAQVTLTLRSGATFTGTLARRPGSDHSSVSLSDHSGHSEVQHDVLLSEVAAITAVAR